MVLGIGGVRQACVQPGHRTSEEVCDSKGLVYRIGI